MQQHLYTQGDCLADITSKNHYLAQLFKKPLTLWVIKYHFGLNSAWTKHQIFKMFNGTWSKKQRGVVWGGGGGQEETDSLNRSGSRVGNGWGTVDSIRERGLWRLMPGEYAWQEMSCLNKLVTDVWRVGQSEKIAPSWMQPTYIIWSELCNDVFFLLW